MGNLAQKTRQHEVWLNPGWPDQQRCYKGDDATAAAMSFALACDRIREPRDQAIWTVDGDVHQQKKGLVG